MRRTAVRLLSAAALVTAGLFTAGPAFAGEVRKEVRFELDKWFELKATDGPVTLHRFRLVRDPNASIKSRITRPSNSRYLEDVKLEIEYSNDASRDWEVGVRVEWVDGDGVVIDGVDQSENLDNEKRFDSVTVTFPTLRYGLDRAKQLKVHLNFGPD